MATALITGASNGIGLELAKVHAAKGGDLVLVARNKSKLDEIKATLENQYKVKVYTIGKDLQQRMQPKMFMKKQQLNKFRLIT